VAPDRRGNRLRRGDGQHRLYSDYQGKFGMDDAGHAAAIGRASDPQAEAGS
jgi:hypothetical protein